MMRMFPIMAALDADEDGEISAAEIDNAVAALKSLDKDSDGKLSADELRPEFGRGGRGFGGRTPDPAAMVKRYMDNDKNDDKVLTKDELPEQLERMFARMDANSDDSVSEEEVTTFVKAQLERRGGGGRRGEGGDAGGRRRRPQRPE